jgi:thiol-disulfide isomerase/thioredoxin
VAELDAAIAGAGGRSVMLDFYADWCVSCKEMERFTFSDAEVHDRLRDVLLLKADVTANNADDKALLASASSCSARPASSSSTRTAGNRLPRGRLRAGGKIPAKPEQGPALSADSLPVKPSRPLLTAAGRAIGDYGMIRDGDRVLLGLSGGKDSLSLLHILLTCRRRRRSDSNSPAARSIRNRRNSTLRH